MHAASGDTPETATMFDHGRSSDRSGPERRHHESDDARSVRRCPPASPNNDGVGRDAITQHPAGTGGEATGICSHDRLDNHLAFPKATAGRHENEESEPTGKLKHPDVQHLSQLSRNHLISKQ
jgi:hypothetical protein